MSLLQNPCSVCGLAILSGDSFIGTGDGQMTNGGSFAHDVCYYRDQANHLQKLCEEQRVEIEKLRSDFNTEVDRQTEKLGYENVALQSQLATQTEQSYMKVWHDCNGKPRPYPNVLCSCHPGNVQMREFDPLKELATQTERVRQAEALLRSAHRWLPDNLMTLSGEPNTKERIYAFLKQESLGDGGKNA